MHNPSLEKTKENVHAALCDNVDTVTVMRLLRDLVSLCNVYSKENEKPGKRLNLLLIRSVAVYITDILRVFGLVNDLDGFGFSDGATGDASDIAAKLADYSKAYADFYSTVASRCDELGPDSSVAQELRAAIDPAGAGSSQAPTGQGASSSSAASGAAAAAASGPAAKKHRETLV